MLSAWSGAWCLWVPPGCLLGASWVPPGCFLGRCLLGASRVALHTLAPPFLRNRDCYFVTATLKTFPPGERVGGDVNSSPKPCTPWVTGAPCQSTFPATEAVIMDSIDTKEGFLCNANAEQNLPHHEYAVPSLIENELCERRLTCSAACRKQT